MRRIHGMDFNLKIVIDRIPQNSLNWHGQSYYTNNHFDCIDVCNNCIEINGNRSKPINLAMLLFNTNSTLYMQILKALSFYYLCTGDAFRITRITLKSKHFEAEEEETVFLQPFQNSLQPSLTMQPAELIGLFSDSPITGDFLNAIILFIKGVQEKDFDYYWKSFNSLYSIISTSDKENEKLRDTRQFIENNKNNFQNSLSLITNDKAEDIRNLRIREFILNNWPNQQSTKAYSDMVKRFTDTRIISVLDETIPYRSQFLKNEGLEHEVLMHLSTYKFNTVKDDVQLLCFYILKYAYFLRNKYFHAEKTTPVFLLKDSAELQELSKISNIMKYFLSDLIRCNNKYF